MINLPVSGSMRPHVSVGKAGSAAAAVAQENTFRNVLDSVYRNSAVSRAPGLYSDNTDEHIISGPIEAYEPLNGYGSGIKLEPEKIDGKPRRAEVYAEYVEIEINGRVVKQVTDEFMMRLGYNLEVLRFNHIDDNLLNYIDPNGFVPKFILPMDPGCYTDYTKVRATPENLAQTEENTAFYESLLSSGTAARPAAANAGDTRISEDGGKPPSEPLKDINKEINVKNIVENRIQGNAREPKPFEKTENPVKIENLAKIVANNAALRILSNLNILNIWDKENENESKDEKK